GLRRQPPARAQSRLAGEHPVTRAPLAIVPPPGPLCWLHPELLAFETGEPTHEVGDELFAKALAAGSGRGAAGPRGDCVRRFLRQRRRDASAPALEIALAGDAGAILEERLSEPSPRPASADAIPLLAIDPARALDELERALAQHARGSTRGPP